MSKLGKRYKCEICGSEVLCTKAGEGTFICCEQEMKVQEPRPLPSSGLANSAFLSGYRASRMAPDNSRLVNGL